jgi:putative CocE/NonD family hydrolase
MSGNRFAIGGAAWRGVRLVLLSAAWLWMGAAAAAAATVQQQGYIPMADGTQLAYTAVLPQGTGRFPVALVYDGYCEGAEPMTCNDPASAKALLAAGYAVLGVSVRGTSCSTGTFDPFVSQHWKDGAAAVEWAARQPWSNTRVGMFGDSFPGITQIGVAGLRPRHLRAIAPFQVGTDLYRDVAAPGGIPNSGFGSFWGLVNQPAASFSSAAQQGCAQTQPTHLASVPTQNIFLQGLQHLFDDSYWQARRPGANAAKIDVPAFSCLSWQDDEISSRGSFGLGDELDPARTWVVAANGYHAMCDRGSPRIVAQLVAFFDRFVKGKRNGFKKTPRFKIWHDAHTGAGENVPGWVTRFKSYSSIRVRPLALYFRSDGALSLTPPKGQATPNRYAYPGPAASNENGVVAGQRNLGWKAEVPPGSSVAYATPPLTGDAEFFGSGSANIWMSTTAPAAPLGPGAPGGLLGVGADTDLQITLTEVRPDGQEVYVARGWLRASHRTLDRARSTRLAPFHTHQEKDALPLVPGRPTNMRVQLWPFDYVFRKGSSVRLWIDAPTGATGGWSFDYIKTPATNSVYADATHASAIVLGRLRGGRAKAPLPACDTLLNQPCRSNPAPVPPGTLTIR